MSDVRQEAAGESLYCNSLKISQGELFEGKVDLMALHEKTKDYNRVHWCRDDVGVRDASVLVKVSSLACYGIVTHVSGVLRQYRYNLLQYIWYNVRTILSPSLFGLYIP
jgi:hypothetical protein